METGNSEREDQTVSEQGIPTTSPQGAGDQSSAFDSTGFGADAREAVTRLWGLTLFRGIIAIVFGAIAIAAPAAALIGIVFVFAAYAIVDGIFAIAYGIQLRDRLSGWGWLIAQGVVAILVGALAIVFPVFAGTVGAILVLWTIVFSAIVNGVAGIPAAVALGGGKKAVALVFAVLSIVFGILLAILLFSQPLIESVLSLIWVVGIWAVVGGILLIALAVQARSAAKTL